MFSELAVKSLVSPQLMFLLYYQKYFYMLVLRDEIFAEASFCKVQVQVKQKGTSK